MTAFTALLLGFGLGVRHATDADHVVVVSALVQREAGTGRAARIAAVWGAGHSVALLGLGLPVVLADLSIPAGFERIADLLVAVMLVGFGLWHLASSPFGPRRPAAASTATASARPAMLGLVHGLAGSAGVAVLAATTIAPRSLAAAYLGLFALGTVLGMVALTVVLSRPIGWVMRRDGRLAGWTTVVAALSSLAIGGALLAQTL